MRNVREPCERCHPQGVSGQEGHILPQQGETEILAETDISEAALRAALDPTGYGILAVTTEPYEKKGLFGFRKQPSPKG